MVKAEGKVKKQKRKNEAFHNSFMLHEVSILRLQPIFNYFFDIALLEFALVSCYYLAKFQDGMRE